MDQQRRSCKGPCLDAFLRETPWGASARRSRHPSSKLSKYNVSWRPSPSTVAAVYSNKCSPLRRGTSSCRSGFPSKISLSTSPKHPGDGTRATSLHLPWYHRIARAYSRLQGWITWAFWQQEPPLPPSCTPHCQSTPLQGCPLLALQWKRATNTGANTRQVAQTTLKTGGSAWTGRADMLQDKQLS